MVAKKVLFGCNFCNCKSKGNLTLTSKGDHFFHGFQDIELYQIVSKYTISFSFDIVAVDSSKNACQFHKDLKTDSYYI